MERNVVFSARELSVSQRQAAELLLGAPLGDDEIVGIRTVRGEIVKTAPGVEVRNCILDAIQSRAEVIAERVAHVPQTELDAVLAEAIEAARRSPTGNRPQSDSKRIPQ